MTLEAVESTTAPAALLTTQNKTMKTFISNVVDINCWYIFALKDNA